MLHFERHGTGAGLPLIFVHGFCETSEIWKDFVKPLSLSKTIFTVDLPGFGKSPALDGPFSIDQVADAVVQWLREQSLTESIFIGHSLGGYVCLSLAARYPDMAKGLVLFHSTAFPDTPEKKTNRYRIISFVKQNGVLPFIDTFVPGLFYDASGPAAREVHRIARETNLNTLIDYTAAMRDRSGHPDVLESRQLPKLIIAGKNDQSVPIDMSREMAKISQNYRYLELDNNAHMGLFEATDDTRAVIMSFSNQIPGIKL